MAKSEQPKQDDQNIQVEQKPTKPTCGIIMPISATDGYLSTHWSDVLSIIKEAVNDEFEPSLVSESDSVGLIHHTIVTKIYNSEIVVCDVSSKNPNVMLELGLRLAFDKPVIIIKDNQTDYSFDTSVIEHLIYPATLRFAQIGAFKNQLREKVKSTVQIAEEDPSYSPFLRHFSNGLKAASITPSNLSAEQALLINEMSSIKENLFRLTAIVGSSAPNTNLNNTRKSNYIPSGMSRNINFFNLFNDISDSDFDRIKHVYKLYSDQGFKSDYLISNKDVKANVQRLLSLEGVQIDDDRLNSVLRYFDD